MWRCRPWAPIVWHSSTCHPRWFLSSARDALLHPAFFEAAALLRSAGVNVNTITNGWLITDKTADMIAELFGAVEVSIDGANSDSHDRIRGRVGSFERAMRAVSSLTKRGVEVTVALTPTRSTIPEFDELIELVRPIEGVKRVVTGYVLPTGRAYRNPEMPSIREQEVFRKHVLELQERYRDDVRITCTVTLLA